MVSELTQKPAFDNVERAILSFGIVIATGQLILVIQNLTVFPFPQVIFPVVIFGLALSLTTVFIIRHRNKRLAK